MVKNSDALQPIGFCLALGRFSDRDVSRATKTALSAPGTKYLLHYSTPEQRLLN